MGNFWRFFVCLMCVVACKSVHRNKRSEIIESDKEPKVEILTHPPIDPNKIEKIIVQTSTDIVTNTDTAVDINTEIITEDPPTPKPVDPIIPSPTPVTDATEVTPPTPVPSSDNNSNTGAIVGGVLGGAAAIAAIVGGYLLLKGRHVAASSVQRIPVDHANPGSVVHPNSGSVVHPNSGSVVHPNPSSVVHPNPSSVVHSNPSSVVHSNPSSVVHSNPSSVVHSNPSSVVHSIPKSLGSPGSPASFIKFSKDSDIPVFPVENLGSIPSHLPKSSGGVVLYLTPPSRGTSLPSGFRPLDQDLFQNLYQRGDQIFRSESVSVQGSQVLAIQKVEVLSEVPTGTGVGVLSYTNSSKELEKKFKSLLAPVLTAGNIRPDWIQSIRLKDFTLEISYVDEKGIRGTLFQDLAKREDYVIENAAGESKAIQYVQVVELSRTPPHFGDVERSSLASSSSSSSSLNSSSSVVIESSAKRVKRSPPVVSNEVQAIQTSSIKVDESWLKVDKLDVLAQSWRDPANKVTVDFERLGFNASEVEKARNIMGFADQLWRLYELWNSSAKMEIQNSLKDSIVREMRANPDKIQYLHSAFALFKIRLDYIDRGSLFYRSGNHYAATQNFQIFTRLISEVKSYH